MASIGALISLSGSIVSAILSVYIFAMTPKKTVTYLWSRFFLILCAYTLAEFMILEIGPDDVYRAFAWNRLAMFGCFIPVVFFHLTLVYPERRGLLDNIYMKVGLVSIYLINTFLFVWSASTRLNQELIQEYGLVPMQGWLGDEFYPIARLSHAAGGSHYAPHVGFLILLFIAGIVVLFFSYRNAETDLEKKKVRIILLASLPFLLLSVSAYFSQIGVTGMGILVIGPLIAYGMMKHKIIVEPIKPASETLVPDESVEELKPGNIYLVRESSYEESYKLFVNAIARGSHGLLITPRNPMGIRDEYNLKRTPIIWLTEDTDAPNLENVTVISPGNLGTSYSVVEEFAKKSGKSILLLDDIDLIFEKNLALKKNRKNLLKLGLAVRQAAQKVNMTVILRRRLGLDKGLPILERHMSDYLDVFYGVMLEDLCNLVVRIILNRDSHAFVFKSIEKLRMNDAFFDRVVFEGGEITFREIPSLDRYEFLDKSWDFISAFEGAKSPIHDIFYECAEKYGVSKYEYRLHRGGTFIIMEERPDLSYRIVNGMAERGFRALVITVTNPKHLKRKFDLDVYEIGKNIKALWLTDLKEAEGEVVSPKLEHIIAEIRGFTERSSTDKGVIQLDGIEYLITYSGGMFDRVLKFLREVSGRISDTELMLIVPLHPGTLNENQIIHNIEERHRYNRCG